MELQVLIVGAGPVGLTLAIELARYGVAVRIVDKSAARTDKSKAVAVWSRTLELFDRAGLAAGLVAAGLPTRAANITTGTERIGRLTFDGLDTAYPFVLLIPQSETERVLEEHLARLGVTVERQVSLVSLAEAGDAVSAVIEQADGRQETLSVPWLAGCDGAHSTVRHSLGFEFRGDTVEEAFVLADIRLASRSLPADELVMFWHRDGIVALFPLPGGRMRLVASEGFGQQGEGAEPDLAEVQAILDQRRPGDLTASDPAWIARFRINERKVDSYRSGRVFLAGDAAHVHSPAGGQGMNTGMQDAFNLAWKLALVCHGEAPHAILDSYGTERSAVAASVIANAGRLTRIAMLANPVARDIRNFVAATMLGFSAVRHAAGEMLSELAVHYGESPLNGVTAAHAPAAGSRILPDPRLPVGAGARPRFALHGVGDAADLVRLGPAGRQLTEDRLRPPLDARALVLVRPDGYVATSARAGDWQAIDAYLAELG